MSVNIHSSEKGCSRPVIIAIIGGCFVVLAAFIGIFPELIKLGIIPIATQSPAITTPQITGKVLNDYTSLRDKPTTVGTQIGSAQKGDTFLILARAMGIGQLGGSYWYQVKTGDGKFAWIYSFNVEISPNNSQVPTVTIVP